MRFKSRALKPYAEPVIASELKEGGVYFSLGFLDRDMLVPAMEPFVFIGRNLGAEDSSHVYFQDYASYQRGLRFKDFDTADAQEGKFIRQRDDQIGYVFEYERALELLMACSIRRTASSGRNSRGGRGD